MGNSNIPRTGEMRQRVTLMQNFPIPDGYGGTTDNYQVQATCWGKLRQRSAVKRNEQGEITNLENWDLWVRYLNADSKINSDSIWMYNGMNFRIQSYVIIDQIKHWYHFSLTSVAF